MKRGKKMETKFIVLAVIAVIAVYLAYSAGTNTGTDTGTTTQQETLGQTPVVNTKTCPDGSTVLKTATCPTKTSDCTFYSPSNKFVSTDKYDETSRGVNARYRIVGSTEWKTTFAGATFNLNPGTTIEYYTGVDNTSSYGSWGFATIPCLPYPEIVVKHAQTDSTPSISVIVWNPDGTVSSATNLATLNSGDVKNYKVELQSPYKSAYGSPWTNTNYGNLLTCHYNTTSVDALTATDLNGKTFKTGNVPVVWNTTAGFTQKAYQLPALDSNTPYQFLISVDADDTNAPNNNTYSETAAGSPGLGCTLFDVQAYYDSTAGVGSVLYGVEDEGNSNLGIADDKDFRLYSQ